MELRDKRIVVTGATGIAAAGATYFSTAGASIFVVSREPEECRHLAERLGAGWAAADLSDERAAVAAFSQAATALGGFDGLFAVAGGSGRSHGDGPLHEIPLSGWEATIAMNLSPAFMAARETVRVMLAADPPTPGSIVLVTSVLATHPSPRHFATHAYAAAKGAIVSMTRSMAAFYADNDIRVNAIAPGLVDTPMAKRARGDPETVAYAGSKQPLARGFLDAIEVAAAAAFLLGDGSRRVTGQTLEVDAGWGVTEA